MLISMCLSVLAVSAVIFVYKNDKNSQTKITGPRAIIFSSGSGRWNNPGNWNPPRVPQEGDSIILKKGHTVSLQNTNTYKAVSVVVYGNLWMDHAAKLQLDEFSTIEVFGLGTIDGDKKEGSPEDSTTTSIEIGGKLVWHNEMGAVTGYSYFTKNGHEAIGLLPVKLAYFIATAENGKVLTQWATLKEENNQFFTVERSTDGKSFQKVGIVHGAGNSHKELVYSFTDEAPLSGTSYYRLKQTNYQGKYEYFNLVPVSNQRGAARGNPSLNIQAVGPNPFRKNFYVNFDLTKDGPVEVRLTDVEGRLVVSEIIDGFSGSNRYDFIDQKELKAGVYLLALVQNKHSSKTIRLIKK